MAKMNWIYEAPGDSINREEYLLGKKVDKYVDPSLQAAEKEKHLLATTPGALFASASSNATVDLENKIREDPLFEIKKREQEAKKRLASNPVKLKQLRALVDEVKSSSGGGKKKKKKHKHKRKGLESSEDEARTKSKSETTSRRREYQHDHRVNEHKADHSHRQRSRSPAHVERHHRSPQHSNYKDRRSSHDSRRYHRQEQQTVSKKLSREELERKRQEMMSNAEWHAQKAEERMRKHRLEEKEEEMERQEHAGKEQEFVDPLMAETLADATAGTISDRIHRKIGSVQRTRAALEGNFTRK